MVLKFKYFLLWIALCLCLLSCGDEGVLLNDLVPTAPPASDADVGPVPEDIQEMLWGPDVDTLKAELRGALNDPQNADRPADLLIHEICFRRERQAYYRKYISAGGVAIMGHGSIDDRVFYAARDIVLGMTQKRPELRAALTPTRERRPGATQSSNNRNDVTGRTTPAPEYRMILVAEYVPVLSVPELRTRNPADLAAGAHGSFGWAVVGWGNPSDEAGYISYDFGVFIHEFAHAIHNAIELLDTGFHARLTAAYAEALASAKENGPVFGYYGLTSQAEYWAEGTKYYFTKLAGEGKQHRHDRFRELEPLMYDLLSEWYDLMPLGYVEFKRF